MISADRDALLCDLAETYGIFDFRALPVSTLATLASGLREESRIKMRLSGGKISRRDLLLAAAVDRLSLLVWSMSEDAKYGTNRPGSLVEAFLGEDGSGEVMSFGSAEDFEAAWSKAVEVSYG